MTLYRPCKQHHWMWIHSLLIGKWLNWNSNIFNIVVFYFFFFCFFGRFFFLMPVSHWLSGNNSMARTYKSRLAFFLFYQQDQRKKNSSITFFAMALSSNTPSEIQMMWNPLKIFFYQFYSIRKQNKKKQKRKTKSKFLCMLNIMGRLLSIILFLYPSAWFYSE